LLLLALTASAGLVGTDPPGNLVVMRGGMDWVWASPCAAEQPSCGATLTMHDGYQIPTDAQWLDSFSSATDIYNAFDGGAMCASPYFNSGYTWCDGSDVLSGYIWHSPFANDYGGYSDPASDSFLVSGGAVPEPSTYALIGLGLAALFARRRRS
jgi:hypothetical protein